MAMVDVNQRRPPPPQSFWVRHGWKLLCGLGVLCGVFLYVGVNHHPGMRTWLLFHKVQKMQDMGQRGKETIKLYEEIVQLTPEHAIAQYELGVLYIEAKQKFKVLRQMERLRELKRSDLAHHLDKLWSQFNMSFRYEVRDPSKMRR